MNNSLFTAVTETWLNSDIRDNEILCDMVGYVIFRGDQENREGGGVALLPRNELTG